MGKRRIKKSTKFTIKSKLIIVSFIILIISNLVLGVVSYNIAKKQLEQNGKTLLKNSVEMTLLVIDEKQKLVEQGKLTLDEAQEQVREYMLGKKQKDGTRPINKNICLGENGYLLAYTQDGYEAAHPILEGKNVWEAKDKRDGFYLVQDQIKIGNNGGGYLTYWWNIPNSEEIAPKITYQKTDLHWGWVVSAGTYMYDFNKGASKIYQFLIIILASSFIIGGYVIFIFARHISVPIGKINQAINEVASGNLNISNLNIKNRDETGELSKSFNIMIQNIRELIKSVKDSVDIVFESSKSLADIGDQNIASINEVAVAIEQITEAADKQAEDTENGVVEVKQLADKIEIVEESSVNTNNIAVEASELSKKGINVVKLLMEKSNENSIATTKANDIIQEMNKSSIEIETITETISQISDQTNLLALNAAIEAARAGEQGRGFAVVAEEVRKLAEQSSLAATKVKELIDGIQKKSKTAVETMEQGKKIAEKQDNAVEETKNTFNGISKAIDNMVENVEKINSYSIDMGDKKGEIIEIFENFSASTEESSAAIQQVSAAIEEQLASVQQINSHTQDFKILAGQLAEAINKFNI